MHGGYSLNDISRDRQRNNEIGIHIPSPTKFMAENLWVCTAVEHDQRTGLSYSKALWLGAFIDVLYTG